MHPSGKRPCGFTLLEILVVLAIVGMLASVALPQLQRMATSVELSNQRTNLKLAIEGLGYQAYAGGKPLVLNAIPSDSKDGKQGLPLQVPEGWWLSVSQPIRYAINGVCGGGMISIIDPEKNRETFLLKPPLCRLDPADISE